jgi:hypothetical protein
MTSLKDDTTAAGFDSPEHLEPGHAAVRFQVTG